MTEPSGHLETAFGYPNPGLLTAGLVHDVNNLLAVILGSAESLRMQLRDPGTPSRNDELLDSIEGAVLQARDLVIDAVQIPCPSAQDGADISELCATVTAAVRVLRTLLPSSIRVDGHVPTESRVWVSFPAVQIHRILWNLAINARDAMPNGGRLSLSVALETGSTESSDDRFASQAVITVTDTGEGIPYDAQPRIFVPFFTTKAPGEGTGLGLAVVSEIIKARGGSIGLESEPGRGTTFTIKLPVERVDPPPAGGENGASPTGTSLHYERAHDTPSG